MNVVLLPGSISSLAGGLYTSVRRLSEALSRCPNLNTVVVGNRDSRTDVDVSVWQSSPVILKHQNALFLAKELQNWLLDANPHIVHSQFLWSYASIATVSWQRKRPSGRIVISPRGMLDEWALQNSWWKKRVALAAYERWHLESAACLHALTDTERDSIRTLGLRNPVCVIPNGVDLPADFASVDEIQAARLRARHGNRKVLLYLGRIHRKKGLLSLIRAWSKTHRQIDDWKLVIAGWDDRGHQSELEAESKRCAMHADSIQFVGPMFGAAKERLLLESTAFILPSLSEGLPISVLEAWSFGLPTILTPQCNLELSFELGAARRIEPDVDGIIPGLRWLAETSEGDLCEMGKRGYQIAATRFSWKRAATQMHEVYQWVLDGGKPPSCVQFN